MANGTGITPAVRLKGLSLSKTYALKYWWCSPVPVGNLRSEILMVQSAQNWHRQRATDSLDGTRDRRVLVQRGRRTRRNAMAIARHSSHSELSPRTLLRRHRRPAGLYRAEGIAAYAAARGLRGPRARPDRG